MSPNPNGIKYSPGEIHPGWRFILGLERLISDNDKCHIPRNNYPSFTTALAKSLGWLVPDAVLSQYESFITLAKHGEENQKDANRNREAYGTFRRYFKTAYDIRSNQPDVLAMPHLYESILSEAMPPLVTYHHDRLNFASPSIRSWYLPYLSRVSLVQQVFGAAATLKCVYRYFKIESACPHTKNVSNVCYVYPSKNGSVDVTCNFPRFLSNLGLILDS